MWAQSNEHNLFCGWFCFSDDTVCYEQAAVAQEAERLDHQQGWGVDPRLFLSMCQSVSEQSTEHQVAPDGQAGISVCVNEK